MADSLRLKGAKHVIKHTGDEMKLRRPKRGGDVHQVPTWWALKKTVTYTGAAIFDVNSTVGPLTLIVPVDAEGTDLGIKHNGDGTFTFTIKRGVDRVAVMSGDMKTFYVEYQFSKISGGPTLKRTVNALPTAFVAPVVPEGPTFVERVEDATFTYTVTVDSGEFELNGVANAGIAGAPGDIFYFDLSDASNAGHPLKIYTDSSKTTEVTVGVEQQGTDLLFEPPISGTFSYQCANHADMGGTITIS